VLCILYKNEGLVTLYVKGSVAITKDGTGPLLEVEAVETLLDRTGDGGVGGGTPPVKKIVVGISGFPEEETRFSSITILFKGAKRSFNRGWSGVISVTQSLQKTLIGLAFSLAVARVALV
jgi:hypothetical protein